MPCGPIPCNRATVTYIGKDVVAKCGFAKLAVVGNSRGRPRNAPAAFIHPCQPIVAAASVPSENFIQSVVRALSENCGIILFDAYHPVRARNIYLRSVQIAAAASSREPVSAPSTQYRVAAGTASASIARW